MVSVSKNINLLPPIADKTDEKYISGQFYVTEQNNWPITPHSKLNWQEIYFWSYLTYKLIYNGVIP